MSELTMKMENGEGNGSTSHQLKNRITTMSLSLELLAIRLKGEHDAENLRIVRDIQEQIAHLVRLIDDV